MTLLERGGQSITKQIRMQNHILFYYCFTNEETKAQMG